MYITRNSDHYLIEANIFKILIWLSPVKLKCRPGAEVWGVVHCALKDFIVKLFLKKVFCCNISTMKDNIVPWKGRWVKEIFHCENFSEEEKNCCDISTMKDNIVPWKRREWKKFRKLCKEKRQLTPHIDVQWCVSDISITNSAISTKFKIVWPP